MFGRGRRGGGPSAGGGPRRGADVEARLTLDFADAAKGLTTTLYLTTDAQCTDGKACKDNRCIAREDAPPACQVHADCASGQACRDGACVVPKEGDADYEAVYGTPAQPPPAEGPASGLDAISGRMLCGEEVRVFFGFNESMLNEDAREMLQRVATCLKKNPSWNVTILGHTDSRGSTEYNLALGERRALAVRLYLKDLGLDPKRAVPVSAGEERPLDPGGEEAAWAKNRRAELLPRQ